MKTVLITGSSRGIGRETAIYFAQQGWNVIIHGFRHPEKLESLKNEILEENVSCLSFCGDISDPSFVDEMIKQSLLTFSKIDCLVNNAGISLVGLFTDATVDDWNLMINTNLTSVFTTCKNIVPHMLHHHEGKIINISSIWGDAGASCEVLYSTTKGGINAFTKALAKEVAASNIQVNAIAFGMIDTEMNVEHYWEEMIRYYSNIVGKYGSPVQRALQKLSGLDIQTICSTHGPVWREYASKAIDIYDRMSRYEGEEGVVIIYGSMYGNTEQMAEAIAASLADNGIKNIVMHNVSHTSHSFIIADVFKYKGLIVGCPTYNTQMYPEMEALLSKLASREIKGRYLGYFGSFTWASAAVKKIAEFNDKLKFEPVGNPVEMKHSMKAETNTQAKELAKAMADRLKADRK